MAASLSTMIACGLFILFFSPFVSAATFAENKNYNLAVYWGQDSAGHQQRLSFYCNDDTIDIIPLAFVPTFFDEGGLPSVDFANVCSWGGNAFQGTHLANCAFLAEDIKKCQSNGKIILISLGGAVARVGFGNDPQAEDFAKTIWDLFLGGKHKFRPFGDAILDGIDLDIEKGSPAHYPAFINHIRSLASGTNRNYYISAAPQCPFPDQYIGDALDQVHLDFVFVQFYNNYCQVSNPSQFNFGAWDHWARNTSPNPNVRVFLGAAASPEAAGQGYVDIGTLSKIAKDAQKRYPSFGGVMLWDADTAYNNNKFHVAIKKAISVNAPAPPPRVPGATPPSSSSPPSKPTPPFGQRPSATPTPLSDSDSRKIGKVRPPQFQRDDMPIQKRRPLRFSREAFM